MPTFSSNGQQISANWNSSGSLQHFTAIAGTDSAYFQPVNDRGHYSPGVLRQLPTGGTYYSGYPTVEFVHAWISDGQIETMRTTYGGNVTIKHHIADSVGSSDVQTSNAINVTDYNQLEDLERVANGYRDFKSKFVIVEVI